ncbi:MAG: hypothetical protein V1797_18780 [Pseudomonadota bacterium]
MKDAGLAWGLGAWVAAALNGCNMYSIWAKDSFAMREEPLVIGLYALPAAWLFCVAAMLLTRQRRLVWYWWVAVSLPGVANFWLFFLWISLMSTTTVHTSGSPAPF